MLLMPPIVNVLPPTVAESFVVVDSSCMLRPIIVEPVRLTALYAKYMLSGPSHRTSTASWLSRLALIVLFWIVIDCEAPIPAPEFENSMALPTVSVIELLMICDWYVPATSARTRIVPPPTTPLPENVEFTIETSSSFIESTANPPVVPVTLR
jgi:hypothetical protein